MAPTDRYRVRRVLKDIIQGNQSTEDNADLRADLDRRIAAGADPLVIMEVEG
jgi:hypothetical protein